LGNALDYSPPDSTVSIRLDGVGDYVDMRIHNEGEPMPSEVLARIFDPFRQPAAASRKGLGLGLYIVSQIVHAHEGTIEASSTSTEGTTLRVRLPRVANQ